MMSRVRSLVVATCMLAMICAPPVLGGCATVGSDHGQDIGKISTRNGSPVTLSMVDADGTWGVNGVGPARYSSVTDKGIDTLQTGTTPRDIGRLRLRPSGFVGGMRLEFWLVLIV